MTEDEREQRWRRKRERLAIWDGEKTVPFLQHQRITELENALREVEGLLTGAMTMPGNTIRAVGIIREVLAKKD